MKSSFICEAILNLILFECLDTSGQSDFVILGARDVLPCIISMSQRRRSSMSSVKTKKERAPGTEVPYYFEGTYFVRSSGIRKKLLPTPLLTHYPIAKC